ncbi:sulfotransferase family 2 domain-containing protein [uncultured Marivita sp.]|uniref:sulfotransferase family 2 domain-containing protein n=1 Tax=uncultured Marivita sp. TaxID=888080 RepID=UPI00262BE528|nr:sulfotransferase family 2 domain-containing protein [uncultured Marivita sp.]
MRLNLSPVPASFSGLAMIFGKRNKANKPTMNVVMHVPKTGGASVSAGLQKTFGTERVLRCDWFDQLVKHSKKNGLSGYDIVICHLGGRELSYLRDDFNLKISTFLRDPIERVFSNYRFWRQTAFDVMLDVDGVGKIPMIDPTLHWKDDLDRILLRSSEIWKYRELVDVATWQFATSIYERTGRSQNQALSEAKRRLRTMGFVGFQASLHADYVRLASTIEGTAVPEPLEKINRTEKQDGLVLDDDARSLITKYNALDVELYEWACTRFATTGSHTA